jgi:predicted nucleotide-binding protein (sugar kinase/HSP70/actin superfamily)
LKKDSEVRYFKVSYPIMEVFANKVSLALIDRVKRIIHGKARRLAFLDEPVAIREFAASTDHLMHHTFTPGEGWLITAEILHQAALGVESFVILQPFGCIPNHVVGRGMVKKIKEIYPGIQIVALDFDPDTSFANIENRLQMLVMNARHKSSQAPN